MARQPLYLPVMIVTAVLMTCAAALLAMSKGAEATFPGKLDVFFSGLWLRGDAHPHLPLFQSAWRNSLIDSHRAFRLPMRQGEPGRRSYRGRTYLMLGDSRDQTSCSRVYVLSHFTCKTADFQSEAEGIRTLPLRHAKAVRYFAGPFRGWQNSCK